MATPPLIGYHNLLEDTGATIIGDSQSPYAASPTENPAAAGFLIANAYDWLDYDFWKATNNGVDAGFRASFSSARTANYFAVAAHDLASQGASIVLQYYSGGAWQNCFPAVSPTNNNVIFRDFIQQSSTQWRVLVSSAPTAAVSLGVVSFGNYLLLTSPVGIPFTPPNFANADQVLNNRSDGGSLLGRSVIGKGIDMGKVSFELMLPGWMRTNWIPFMAHAKMKPFFFQWDYLSFPNEAALVWTRGKVDTPEYNMPKFMRASLDLVGRFE